MLKLTTRLASVAVSICAVAAPAAGAPSLPDFAPNASVGWIALSTEFISPSSGAGPAAQDPGTFTMPWDAMQRYRRVEPGKAENDVPLTALPLSAAAGPLFEMSCAENPGAYFGRESVSIPHVGRAAF